ncbi:NAD-dependent epimerase/dehydratase (fragment) [Mesorhizobium metallidurans STM 2683]|uniref:NAD-dependent epimerase/dehydratase n=1 Tax=Mesorhizobium metallidurans STM 2683 TaxID=1297569 RepID=M5EMU6_9HYPH
MRLVRRLPVYPLFGDGATRLQPVYVGDVAEAVSRLIDHSNAPLIFEFGGPRVLSYEELVREIARSPGRRPMLVPMPFAVWNAVAALAEFIPATPVKRNQVDLMRVDNVAATDLPGLKEVGVKPRDIQQIIGMIKRTDD